jgi:RNA polymerase sigma-70 factor (ECF subfamily)
MAPASSQDAAAVFDPLRQRLVRVAHRMLGAVADADDVLQDAFLRLGPLAACISYNNVVATFS